MPATNARSRASRPNLLLSCLAAVGPVAVILVQPTFELLIRNRAEIGDGLAPAGWLLGSALLLWCAGALLAWLGTSRVSRWAAATYFLLGPGWILYKLFSPTLGPLSSLAILGIALPMIGAVFVSRMPIGRILPVFAVVGVSFAVPAAAKAAQVVRNAPDVSARSNAMPVSASLPNVYHVIFDEFQSDFFKDKLDDKLSSDFAGFTFFPDAITPYGRTEMALPSILSGIAYDYKSPPIKFLWSAFFDKHLSLIQNLKAGGYQTEGYLHVLYPSVEQSPFDLTVFHRKVPRSAGETDNKSGLFTALWAYGSLPPRLGRLLIPAIYWDQLSGGVLLPTQAPVISLNSMNAFLNSEGTRPAHGRYVFLHLLLPHFPHVLDRDCHFHNGDLVGAEEQHGCAVKVMQGFIERLRKLDRLDTSLIIFQSDHGLGYHREGGKLVESKGLFTLPYVEGRARPLLLIKPPGRPQSTLKVSDAPATLLDVAPTIADALHMKPWTSFAGASLLGSGLPPRPERHYHMYNKDNALITDGSIRRYVLGPNGWRFDQSISVPQAGLADLPVLEDDLD